VGSKPGQQNKEHNEPYRNNQEHSLYEIKGHGLSCCDSFFVLINV
jgi:hypothetical protein